MFFVLLLTIPVFVSLFWAAVLHTLDQPDQLPKRMIGSFFLIASVIFFSNLLYFGEFKNLYAVVDSFFILATVVVHPIFYIYFRLLTVDPKFDIKKHGKYFVPGLIVFFLYLGGAISIGFNAYKEWLFTSTSALPVTSQKYMDAICLSSRVLFLFQAILAIKANIQLIAKFGKKARNFYSNPENTHTKYAYMVNYIMIAIAVVSIVDVVLGRESVKASPEGIMIQSFVYVALIFVLGFLTHQQEILNPFYDTTEDSDLDDEDDEPENIIKADIVFESSADQILHEKINQLFQDPKFFLNPNLTINEVASVVGTNRTYISGFINKYYGQNFCAFVNKFRYNHVLKIVRRYPDTSLFELSETCGFGSTDSLKRSIHHVTGMRIKEWRTAVNNDYDLEK